MPFGLALVPPLDPNRQLCLKQAKLNHTGQRTVASVSEGEIPLLQNRRIRLVSPHPHLTCTHKPHGLTTSAPELRADPCVLVAPSKSASVERRRKQEGWIRVELGCRE